MVWQKGSLSSGDGAGHVCVVEKIIDSNTIYTSESGYGGTAFFNSTRSNSNGRWGIGTAYSFRGCIVNPSVDNPTPTPTGDISYIQRTLNERYSTGLVVDGIYGNNTHRAMVIGLQTEFNKQFGANLVVDGIFGNATKNACRNVGYGATGNITWLIQAMLVCKGYNLAIDGIFGNGTKNCVVTFQRSNGLYVDGIVGPNTFEKLFK